jgi:pimeloyl-ACP methyl ester carboxylesterase
MATLTNSCGEPFIQGDKDGFGTVASVQGIQSKMCVARIEVIRDAAHVPWYDEPECCVSALVDFLGSRDQH